MFLGLSDGGFRTGFLTIPQKRRSLTFVADPAYSTTQPLVSPYELTNRFSSHRIGAPLTSFKEGYRPHPRHWQSLAKLVHMTPNM